MRLFVGNLAYSTSEADLRTMFEQAGAVGSCELVSDRLTGQSRGFAFVEMTSSEEGEQAIRRFNEFELDGRKLIVNEARPREARFGGQGGHGGHGGHGGGGGYGGHSGFTGFAPGGGTGGGPGGGAGAFGAKRKSGKGSRRNARSAKRDRKACW